MDRSTMFRRIHNWQVILTVLVIVMVPWSRGTSNSQIEPIYRRFDLKFHKRHSFVSQTLTCTHCHNVEEKSKGGGELTATDALKTATFNRPLGQICHECHKEKRRGFESAPTGCYQCHQSFEDLGRIQPQSHAIVGWKSDHGTQARIAGNECFLCHRNSQCVKCHLHRSDLEMNNHGRNFRFFHSIQARMEPHRCDSCHTPTYCSRCHLGGTK